MPLVPVKLPDALPAVPEEVARFLADAQARIDAFVEARLNDPVHAFVPSDFPVAYGALRHVADEHLATGPKFCEWGSGAGVVACLAATVGFDARGIEFEPALVDLARRLAAAHGLAARFHVGNLVPTAGQRIAESVGELEWLAVGGPDPYEEMGLDVEDFDVIFAYPWPGEQEVIERLFGRFAADGALLLTYNGQDGIRAHRRRAGRYRE